MLRHLFTLVWNRKRANVLLISEIVLSFFVLFAVSGLLIYNLNSYRLPTGFVYDNVWQMQLTPSTDSTDHTATLRLLLQRLRAMPGVVAVGTSGANAPFSFSTMNTERWNKGRRGPLSERYEADDALPQVLQLQVAEGRWFDRRDDAATYPPVVINRAYARAAFGPEPALGQILTDKDGKRPARVVGVVEHYRSGSDFFADEPAFFSRRALSDSSGRLSPTEIVTLLVRVRPGSGAVLEQQLAREIKSTTGSWSTNIDSLAKQRRNKHKFILTPMYALGLVGIFLIINVALGLFGVLWYNISQRRAEIGLRRAMGATSSRISAQFLGEMLIVTVLGVSIGLLLAAQFPLLGVWGISSAVYGGAMLLAAVLVFTITAVCAFQPSRMAAAVQPAVALREE